MVLQGASKFFLKVYFDSLSFGCSTFFRRFNGFNQGFSMVL